MPIILITIERNVLINYDWEECINSKWISAEKFWALETHMIWNTSFIIRNLFIYWLFCFSFHRGAKKSTVSGKVNKQKLLPY